MKKVRVNNKIYHRSNPIFRSAISNKGLVPKGKSENWLSNTKIKGKVIFATNSYLEQEWFDHGYDDDIYEIDTTNINNSWYLDPNFNFYADNKHIITFQPIPCHAIKLIHQGSGEQKF